MQKQKHRPELASHFVSIVLLLLSCLVAFMLVLMSLLFQTTMERSVIASISFVVVDFEQVSGNQNYIFGSENGYMRSKFIHMFGGQPRLVYWAYFYLDAHIAGLGFPPHTFTIFSQNCTHNL